MQDLALPLNQSDAFERTCETLGLSVQRVSNSAGTCLIQTRKLPVIGPFHLISRGPVLREGADPYGFVAEVRARLKGPVVFNAGDQAGGIGGLKVAAGAELALLDLLPEEAMRERLHPKWRNQLRKAERADLTITDQPLDAKKHDWFFKADLAQQKSRKYKSYPAGFLLVFAAANKGQARLYTAAKNGTPVAGMLVLKHDRMATYQAGVTTPEGRTACAHNLLLWRIMNDLQKKRVIQLDLGRADLSEGLARFKKGSGAAINTLPGSFLFHHWFGPRSVPARGPSVQQNGVI